MNTEFDVMTPKSVLKNLSAAIAQQTEEFLKRGGKITQIADAQALRSEPQTWVSTEEAAEMIGVTPRKLLQWRKTNTSCPRHKQTQKTVIWFLPSVIAFAENYKGKRNGREAA